MALINLYNEVGSSGLDEWGGNVQDDFLRELRGIEGYKRMDEMRRNSSVVGALLTAIELELRGVRWNFASEEGEEDQRLELLDASLDNMTKSWNDHISEVLTMLPFGWALFELVYERVGADILLKKIAFRGQDTLDHWQFDSTGGLEAFWQNGSAQTGYKPVMIPIEKCLLYRTRVERNNPEGRSILRNAWIDYYFLKNIRQIEAIGIERDLAGMPWIKLPPEADITDSTTSDLGVAKKIVRNIRRDEQEGLVTPAGYEFELVSTGGSRQFDTNAIIQRYESRILMSALAQFLILGQNGVGTQALSQDMSALFEHSVDAIADIIGETFTKFAIPRLLELNGLDPNGISMNHTPAGEVDLQALGQFLQSVSSFVTWMPADEVWLRDVAKLPEADPEDIEIERERKAAQAVAMFQRKPPPQESEEEQEEEAPDQEDMAADLYAAQNAPDDKVRRKYERQLQVIEAAYLAGLQKRLLTSARKSR